MRGCGQEDLDHERFQKDTVDNRQLFVRDCRQEDLDHERLQTDTVDSYL